MYVEFDVYAYEVYMIRKNLNKKERTKRYLDKSSSGFSHLWWRRTKGTCLKYIELDTKYLSFRQTYQCENGWLHISYRGKFKFLIKKDRKLSEWEEILRREKGWRRHLSLWRLPTTKWRWWWTVTNSRGPWKIRG